MWMRTARARASIILSEVMEYPSWPKRPKRRECNCVFRYSVAASEEAQNPAMQCTWTRRATVGCSRYNSPLQSTRNWISLTSSEWISKPRHNDRVHSFHFLLLCIDHCITLRTAYTVQSALRSHSSTNVFRMRKCNEKQNEEEWIETNG